MLTANKVENVVDGTIIVYSNTPTTLLICVTVAIDYQRFTPSRRAVLELSEPVHTQPALKALQGATVAFMSVNPQIKSEEEVEAPTSIRTRGMKGREQALERGVRLMGNGPHGGLNAATSGRNVVLYGLPGYLEPSILREYLRGFNFAARESEKTQVQKLHG